MKKYFISVLVTNYNKEFFLEQSLKKLCNQSYKNYEIILFDDCSSDNSIKIIKKYKKIKLINNRSQKHKSKALNQINGVLKCFQKSRGDIICLMDADDFFSKNKIFEINKYFKVNKSMNCVFNLTNNKIQELEKKRRKRNFTIWPIIFPTSCISFRRTFFSKFKNYIYKKNFPNLEIDTRMVIFSNFFFKENNILKKKLTTYNYDPKGITSNIGKFSCKWWVRRYEAFEYLKIIQNIKKKEFIKSYDYFLTGIFANIIKFFYKI